MRHATRRLRTRQVRHCLPSVTSQSHSLSVCNAALKHVHEASLGNATLAGITLAVRCHDGEIINLNLDIASILRAALTGKVV